MQTPSFREDHISQLPALQLLINMGYTYLSPKTATKLRGDKTSSVLLEPILKEQLRKINTIYKKGRTYNFSEANINAAILAIKNLPIQEGYIYANQALYDLLTLGKSFEQTIEGDKKSHTFQFIDWQTPENNVFHVTEEFSVLRTARTDHYRPDAVLFINGIPIVVIECKSPSLSGTKSPTELGIEQHLRNQEVDGIRNLYVYSNLLLSIATDAGKYATTGTSKQFWSKWKENHSYQNSAASYQQKLHQLKNKSLSSTQKNDLYVDRYQYVQQYFDDLEKTDRPVTYQDELLYGLCRKERLLDLFYHFTLYDNGVKKIVRYQQYFAIKDIMKQVTKLPEKRKNVTELHKKRERKGDKIWHTQSNEKQVTKLPKNEKRQGGVIWHTQGSGKSLTMVLLAQQLASTKKILNPKIVLVTDRVDLDDQISDTFKKCQKEVQQAKTGLHLAELLREDNDAVITTIINKFEAAVRRCKVPFESSDIFVLIDEGHRTQYGSFNVSMQKVFPNACFLAFTGTPLMKKEKSTAKKFGGFLTKPYTVLDAVADGAVVPLLYEGRHNKITINEDPINRYFEKLAVREKLTEYGKAALKKKFNTVNELNKAEEVIYARAEDISEHYVNFFQSYEDRYKPKAQLVAPTIKTALLYKKYLDEIGQVTSEVIVTRSDTREGIEDAYYGVNPEQEREERYFSVLEDKFGNLKRAEKSIINQFKNDDHPEILIVVAKLLTGFDAPRNTVLYLCRSLKEHTLLQAIARVNRVYPGKTYGYVIDYFGNLANLDNALNTYSGLSNFEEQDLEGTLTNIREEVKKLPQAHADVWNIFKEMPNRKVEATVYAEHLKMEDRRHRFYEKLSVFARLLKLALSSYEFVTTTEEKKIATYKADAKFFLKLRVNVKRRYNDDISYREFEPQVQKLINRHLSTEGEMLKVTELVDVFDKEARDAEVEKLSSKAAKADHIASRTIRAITVKMQEDPVYYKKLAELIRETIEAYHQKRLSEAEYLQQATFFEDEFHNGRSKGAPSELANNETALVFYDLSKTTFEDTNLQTTTFSVEVGLLVDKLIQAGIELNGQQIIDWQQNEDLLGRLQIELGDQIYDLLNKFRATTDWNVIDGYVEECVKVAKLRY